MADINTVEVFPATPPEQLPEPVPEVKDRTEEITASLEDLKANTQATVTFYVPDDEKPSEDKPDMDIVKPENVT